jgi:hypothetical protein
MDAIISGYISKPFKVPIYKNVPLFIVSFGLMFYNSMTILSESWGWNMIGLN